MAKTQQYVVQKYVLASSIEEAVRKSKKLPIHEVYIHGGWFEKMNNEFYRTDTPPAIGFEKKK